MSERNTLLTMFVLCYPIDVIFYHLRKKAKLQLDDDYRYATTSCLLLQHICGEDTFEILENHLLESNRCILKLLITCIMLYYTSALINPRSTNKTTLGRTLTQNQKNKRKNSIQYNNSTYIIDTLLSHLLWSDRFALVLKAFDKTRVCLSL